jgi:hypothetical protein
VGCELVAIERQQDLRMELLHCEVIADEEQIAGLLEIRRDDIPASLSGLISMSCTLRTCKDAASGVIKIKYVFKNLQGCKQVTKNNTTIRTKIGAI